jgi:hypothetical protein
MRDYISGDDGLRRLEEEAMGEWILVIIIVGVSHYPSSATTAAFKTQAACEEAAAFINNSKAVTHWRVVKCFPAGG